MRRPASCPRSQAASRYRTNPEIALPPWGRFHLDETPPINRLSAAARWGSMAASTCATFRSSIPANQARDCTVLQLLEDGYQLVGTHAVIERLQPFEIIEPLRPGVEALLQRLELPGPLVEERPLTFESRPLLRERPLLLLKERPLGLELRFPLGQLLVPLFQRPVHVETHPVDRGVRLDGRVPLQKRHHPAAEVNDPHCVQHGDRRNQRCD